MHNNLKEGISIMQYSEMNNNQLGQEYQNVRSHFDSCKSLNLKLNMARGKPSKMQLDLANDM